MGGRDVAQFGSALDWGSRGRRFKSGRPDAGQRPVPGSWDWPFGVNGSPNGSAVGPRLAAGLGDGPNAVRAGELGRDRAGLWTTTSSGNGGSRNKLYWGLHEIRRMRNLRGAAWA